MKSNGHGGFIWVHHATQTYNYSYPDGSSLTLTVRSSGSHVSYKVRFKTGPSPLPAVKYGSDDSFTGTPNPSPGMAPDPDYKGTATGSWGVAGEVALMVCGWVPVAGAACDAADLGRSVAEEDKAGVVLGAAGFIPLAGDVAKFPKQALRIADHIADTIRLTDKLASPFSTKIDSIAEHVQMKDLTAAARELKGEVVKRKADGTPWDHVHEVRDAQNGLLKTIAAINKKLAHPNTGGAERELYVADLARASRMLDFSEQFVPRG
ncbi:polymorphic toxin type 28 domain-containing protein [Streptomyces doebereineriae]|uniref:Polymorphic toxin type 28 domain-containing protein n=1 Tax=Streptomyces doebereineriae TaxID=3075528 RepID=A0ABU2VG20_9ACTN|nr:polymorphic toxin type 28 domain-containing protein [Streptomyces sp. DSM 41640]MDT0484530.1 polymorphic toxin type 28 domain-containing protein [Streptomyces sp. DSM 41640]